MIVGVLGGGQLGRMLALAGIPLGLRFRFLDESESAPASHVGQLVVGDYDDSRRVDDFAGGLAVVTYEFENVPLSTARFLARRHVVHPSPQALESAQDRVFEKELFQALGISTAPFAAVNSVSDIREGVNQLGLPLVLKTRRFGYDGKGQFVLRSEEQIESAWQSIGAVPAIVEAFQIFDREVSILAVRNSVGEESYYPLVENHHQDGILHHSFAPAPGDIEELQSQAQEYAGRLLRHLEYAGVLAIEFFQKGDELIANEMAPRVHNSGHWTIEGAETSQFENHLRAILGMPLGSTRCTGASVMRNIIGDLPPVPRALAVAGAHVHLYGKDPRPGRKVGHITVCGRDGAEAEYRYDVLKKVLEQ